MESKIVEQKENKLFHRKEARVEIAFGGATPRRSDVLAELSEKLGAPAEQIAILKIDHKFGRRYALVTARVYDSLEQLKKFEHAWVLERGTGKHKKKEKEEKKEEAKAKPAAAAPAAAAPAAPAAPKEEKK
jgi:ribosomal protein S24E